MTTEAQKKAVRKYDGMMTVQKIVKLNKKTDADILKHLEGKQIQTYVKHLIREDMKK